MCTVLPLISIKFRAFSVLEIAKAFLYFWSRPSLLTFNIYKSVHEVFLLSKEVSSIELTILVFLWTCLYPGWSDKATNNVVVSNWITYVTISSSKYLSSLMTSEISGAHYFAS